MRSFVVARDATHRVFAGRPKPHVRWREWEPRWRTMSEAQRAQEATRARLPSAVVAEGEHPDHTVERLLKGQLLCENWRLLNARLYSFGGVREGRVTQPWDFCFVYEMEITPRPVTPPWWGELRFWTAQELSRLVWDPVHGEVARAVGVLEPGEKK